MQQEKKEISDVKTFQEKQRYLPKCYSDKGLKGTVGNQACYYSDNQKTVE